MPDPDAKTSGVAAETTPVTDRPELFDRAEPVALTEPARDAALSDAEQIDRTLAEMPVAGPADATNVLPPPRTPTRLAPRRRGGFLALLLGGALAAAGGFALARYIPGGWPVADTSAFDARIAGVESRLDAVDATLAAPPAAMASDAGLVDRIAALEAAEPPMPASVDLAPLEARLTALESVDVGRDAPTAAIGAIPSVGSGTAPAELAALEARIAAVEARVAAGSTDGAAATAEIEELVTSATARIAEAETRAEALRTQSDAATRSAVLRSALGRVQAALETGAPFVSAVTEITQAGVEVPEALSGSAAEGIPTLSSLQAAFPEAARAALAASTRATMGEGWTDRMTAFLRTQTGARSLVPREGTEPDAVLSRVEAALRTGDLAVVLTEVQVLPPEGQTALADWTALATRRVQATDAALALTAALDAN